MKYAKSPKRKKHSSPLLTAEETSDYLRIPIGTLVVWRARGKPDIPFIKIGESVRYRLDDLEAWLTAQRRTVTKKRRSA